MQRVDDSNTAGKLNIGNVVITSETLEVDGSATYELASKRSVQLLDDRPMELYAGITVIMLVGGSLALWSLFGVGYPLVIWLAFWAGTLSFLAPKFRAEQKGASYSVRVRTTSGYVETYRTTDEHAAYAAARKVAGLVGAKAPLHIPRWFLATAFGGLVVLAASIPAIVEDAYEEKLVAASLHRLELVAPGWHQQPEELQQLLIRSAKVCRLWRRDPVKTELEACLLEGARKLDARGDSDSGSRHEQVIRRALNQQ